LVTLGYSWLLFVIFRLTNKWLQQLGGWVQIPAATPQQFNLHWNSFYRLSEVTYCFV